MNMPGKIGEEARLLASPPFRSAVLLPGAPSRRSLALDKEKGFGEGGRRPKFSSKLDMCKIKRKIKCCSLSSHLEVTL